MITEAKGDLRVDKDKKPKKDAADKEEEAPVIFRDGMELKKIFVMCKFFAYGYPCRWMNRNNECRSVHDEGVRRAFEAY